MEQCRLLYSIHYASACDRSRFKCSFLRPDSTFIFPPFGRNSTICCRRRERILSAPLIIEAMRRIQLFCGHGYSLPPIFRSICSSKETVQYDILVGFLKLRSVSQPEMPRPEDFTSDIISGEDEVTFAELIDMEGYMAILRYSIIIKHNRRCTRIIASRHVSLPPEIINMIHIDIHIKSLREIYRRSATR